MICKCLVCQAEELGMVCLDGACQTKQREAQWAAIADARERQHQHPHPQTELPKTPWYFWVAIFLGGLIFLAAVVCCAWGALSGGGPAP